ncbi:MAG: hypothetical protein P4N41_09125 [Negativicutes bacterium]|nr:hypothetical protein [Negativicutes bacterium]
MYMTAAIEFKLCKQPCKDIRLIKKDISTGQMETPLSYEIITFSAEKMQPVSNTRKEEINGFLEDTTNLIGLYDSEDLYSEPFLHTYLQKWGPPFPTTGNSFTLDQLYNSLCQLHYFIEFWPLPDEDRNIRANEKLLNSFRRGVVGTIGDVSEEESKPLFFTPGLSAAFKDDKVTYTSSSRKTPIWFQCAASPPPENFPLFVIKTTGKEITDLKTKDKVKQLAWLEAKIRSAISGYITHTMPPLEARYQAETGFTYEATIDKRFLFFIVHKLTRELKASPCACGCGKRVPANRKYYDSHKCKERAHNKKPLKSLKSLIRGKKNAGKITDHRKQELYDLSEKLYAEGFDEKEIKREIERQLAI